MQCDKNPSAQSGIATNSRQIQKDFLFHHILIQDTFPLYCDDHTAVVGIQTADAVGIQDHDVLKGGLLFQQLLGHQCPLVAVAVRDRQDLLCRILYILHHRLHHLVEWLC